MGPSATVPILFLPMVNTRLGHLERIATAYIRIRGLCSVAGRSKGSARVLEALRKVPLRETCVMEQIAKRVQWKKN